MNADVFQDRWKQVRSEAQRRWNRLTDQEMDEARGQADRLADAASAASERYGVSRGKAEEQVNRLLERYGEGAKGPLGAARDFVNDNPWAAVAAAMLLLGLIGGLLTRLKPGSESIE